MGFTNLLIKKEIIKKCALALVKGIREPDEVKKKFF